MAGLRGKRLGMAETLRLLAQDPCAPELDARRLSGPLEPVVCGVHLARGYRLAFTSQPQARHRSARVVVLYIGRRDTRHRQGDIWEILHELFDLDNPPDQHLRPPCCEEGMPTIGEEELDSFVDRLRRFQRGRP